MIPDKQRHQYEYADKYNKHIQTVFLRYVQVRISMEVWGSFPRRNFMFFTPFDDSYYHIHVQMVETARVGK